MRVIRPLNVARLLALLLAFGVCIPSVAAEGATKKKTTRTVSEAGVFGQRLAGPQGHGSPVPAPPPAPVNRPGVQALQEAMTPRFKTDATGALVPDIRAAAAIIFNPETGQVLWEENAQDKRSIASITKVMTALVFLEDNPTSTQEITVERSDVYAASTTYLRANERITLDEVLHLTLIASDNAAARALARVSHGGTAAFIERMNEKAVELGLESTQLHRPLGPESRERLVRLRPVAADFVRGGERADRADHAHGGIHASAPAAGRSTSTAPTSWSVAGKST